MTTKINHITSALRESIEIARKATEGPWEHELQQDSIWSGHDFDLQVAHTMSDAGAGMMWDADQRRKNATFISHARTMTPLACKALLLAIEGLESCKAYSPKGDDTAYDALTSITSTWPDA